MWSHVCFGSEHEMCLGLQPSEYFRDDICKAWQTYAMLGMNQLEHALVV